MPYPYEIYDQVLCPDYPAVANEHPGCVHMKESFLMTN